MSRSSAIFSDCLRYRYRLDRIFGEGATVVSIMINPSWADQTYNDRTITKLIGFAKRNGWGKLIVGNKFAFRSQFPKELGGVSDPVGPDNDSHLRDMIAAADICIAAWGPLAKIRNRNFQQRWKVVQGMVQQDNKILHCWGVAKDGHPRHPLMLPYNSVLQPWIAPE